MFASPMRPFIGLRPFDYQDREFFFGRGEGLDALEPLISGNRFVTIVGSSGSGKSSLIRAGLRPRLEIAGDQDWKWVEMHPGEEPIRELARGLASLEDAGRGLAEAWTDRLELLMRRSSFGIAEGLSLFPAPNKGERLLLLVDQFEELFRFADLRAERNHDSATAAEHRDEATAFVRLLLTAANSLELPIHVVVTMRSDFIGDCSRFHGLPEAVTRSQFLVPGLTRDQRAAAICGPVERAGSQVNSGLIQRALNDTNEDPDQLPILQHTMMRCWEYACRRVGPTTDRPPHLTLDDYDQVGGVARALSLHASEILSDLSRTNTDTSATISLDQVTKRVFQALTETDNDGRVVRRPQRFGNLVKYAETETGRKADKECIRCVSTVVERFARPDCSFLRAPPPGELDDASIIDIGHEALIRRWDMLKGDGDTDWIREELDDSEHYRDLLRAGRANGIIPGQELPAVERWWARRRPNRFWAQRYTKNNADHYDAVVQLLERSRARVEELEQQKLDSERAERAMSEARLRAEASEVRAKAAAEVARAEAARAKEAERAAEAKTRAAESEAASRMQRIRWGIGATICAALGLIAFFAYYSRAELARLRVEQEAKRELAFRAQNIASVANAVLLPRLYSGAADALAIAVAKPDKLPDVPEYVRILYRGLGELREQRRITDLPAQVFGVSFSPRQDLLLAVMPGNPSKIRFWRWEDGAIVDDMPISNPGFVMNARWSPDGEHIYVGTSPIATILTPCAHEKLRRYFRSCDELASDLSVPIGTKDQPAGAGAWSPDGKWILTGGFQNPARLWNAESGQPGPSFTNTFPGGPDQPATSVAISTDGARMAIGVISGEVYVVDFASMTLVKSLKLASSGLGGFPFSLAFDPKDSNLLLATYQTPIAQLWDIDAGTSQSMAHDRGNVLRGAFDPQGRFMVTASNDGLVRLWVLNGGPDLTPIDLRGHLGPVFSVDVSADGTIASGAGDRSVRLWGLDAPLSARRLPNATSFPVKASKIRIEESMLVVTSEASEVFRARLPSNFGDVADAAVSIDGRALVVAPRRGPPILFLRNNPDVPMVALKGPDAAWISVAFIEKDSRIAAMGSDGAVYAWPFISDVRALETLAARNLPFEGSERIKAPVRIRCRFMEESPDCTPEVMDGTRQ